MTAVPRGNERGNRSAFLGRARRSAPLQSFRPTVELDRGVPPAVPTRAVTDLAERFAEEAVAVGATFRRLSGARSISDVFDEVLEVDGIRSAVISRDPECEGVGAVLQALGVDVRDADAPSDVAGVDLGVTGAAYGIALTGSVVVAADRAGCRTASLLPPVHVAILRVAKLLATPGELFRHLPQRFPGGLPSNLVVITGPSRSADIELQLTLGVHGPRSLWVVLV